MKLKDDDEEEEGEGAASLAHEQRLVTPPWCLDLRVTLTTAMRVAWGLMTYESVWPWFKCSCRLNSQQDNNSLLHLQGGGPSGALQKKSSLIFRCGKAAQPRQPELLPVRTINLCALQLFSFSVIFYLNLKNCFSPSG